MPADYTEEYTFEGSIKVLNPATFTLDTINTKMERTLAALEVTEDDILLLQQDIVFFEATSGAPLSQINATIAAMVNSSEVYGLDRTTRANVPGEGDASRTGQFTFPGDVQQEAYDYWSSSLGTALTAEFIGEETYEGITVYVFEIDSTGNAYGTDPTTSAPRTIDIYAKLMVEPVSGVTVFANTKTTINLQMPTGAVTAFVNDSTFNQATIDEMVDYAQSTKSLIMWASVYGYWIVLGLGVVMVLVGMLRRSA